MGRLIASGRDNRPGADKPAVTLAVVAAMPPLALVSHIYLRVKGQVLGKESLEAVIVYPEVVVLGQDIGAFNTCIHHAQQWIIMDYNEYKQ